MPDENRIKARQRSAIRCEETNMTKADEMEQARLVRNDYDMLMRVYRSVKAQWNRRRIANGSTPEELRYLILLMSEIETYDMERSVRRSAPV
jgi:hypothetical protein